MKPITIASYLKFFLILSLFIASCKSTPPSLATTLSFSLVEQIKLDSKKETIEQILGKPTQILPVASLIGEIAWLYAETKRNLIRATLVFNIKSEKLISKTWEIYDGYLEQNIDALLKKFPNAKFKRQNAKWINPHIAPDEAYYEDHNLGLSIEIRRLRNEARSITWTMPGAPIDKREVVCEKFQKKSGLVSCKNKIN